MKVLDEIDRSILAVARELFLTQGIRRTEMKDIAVQVQIGRSTLYRRFPSKEIISFYIARDILRELVASVPKVTLAGTGYGKFAAYARAYARTLVDHTVEIRFLDEFDQMFTDSYPELEAEVSSFFHASTIEEGYSARCLREGVEDGSIRLTGTPEYMANLFTQTVMGTAQRILPREAHYIEEHGKGREFLYSLVELFLEGIRA